MIFNEEFEKFSRIYFLVKINPHCGPQPTPDGDYDLNKLECALPLDGLTQVLDFLTKWFLADC